MAQLEASGTTEQDEGEELEGSGNSIPPLREWLVKNNLSDVSNDIESRFKELNCGLSELLSFSKQDLIDFVKHDLKLKSPLKKNRFVNGILRLQSDNNNNNKPIVLSEKENDILIDLQNKMYVSYKSIVFVLFGFFVLFTYVCNKIIS